MRTYAVRRTVLSRTSSTPGSAARAMNVGRCVSADCATATAGCATAFAARLLIMPATVAVRLPYVRLVDVRGLRSRTRLGLERHPAQTERSAASAADASA